MKNLILSTVFVFALSLTFTSCKEKTENEVTTEAVSEAVTEAVEVTEDAVEDAVEVTGDAVDKATDAAAKVVMDAEQKLKDAEEREIQFTVPRVSKDIKRKPARTYTASHSRRSEASDFLNS